MDADLKKREASVIEKEKQAQDDRLAIEREKSRLLEQEKQIRAAYQIIEAEKFKLTERERAIAIAEYKRDAGFADERAALSNELRDKRNQAEADISNIRVRRLSELDDEIAKTESQETG
nr:hypothetical protein [Acetobacter persici]